MNLLPNTNPDNLQAVTLIIKKYIFAHKSRFKKSCASKTLRHNAKMNVLGREYSLWFIYSSRLNTKLLCSEDLSINNLDTICFSFQSITINSTKSLYCCWETIPRRVPKTPVHTWPNPCQLITSQDQAWRLITAERYWLRN